MLIPVMIIQAVVFIGIILLLRHFMKSHVSGALGHVRSLNEDLMRQQEALKKKNQEIQVEYESKMAKLQQEISAKQAQVKQDATKTLEEARNTAMAEKEKIINEAVATRDKIKNEIMAEMELNAVNYSKEIVAEFLSPQMRKQIHESLIQEVVAGLKEVPVEQFQIQSDAFDLLVAQETDAANKETITRVLKEKLSREIHLKESLDPDLVAGIIVKAGTFVIDGSLRHRLNEAASILKKEAKRKYQGTT